MADSDGLRDRITLDPNVLAGKPTIRGMRLSVEHVLRALGAGIPEVELLAEYPDLEPEDLRACLTYAAEVMADLRTRPEPVGA
jgi:uncharacterized protein (DUF433 family)